MDMATVIIKVCGLGPLSFDLKEGAHLKIKEYLPSKKSRPTVSSRFKKNAYLIFNGTTKIGRISPSDQKKLGGQIPKYCIVHKIEKEKNKLFVLFNVTAK